MVDRIQVISNQHIPPQIKKELWLENKRGSNIYYTLSLDDKGNKIEEYYKASPISLLYNVEGKLSIFISISRFMFGSNIFDEKHYDFKSFKERLVGILDNYLSLLSIDNMIVKSFEYGVNIQVDYPPSNYTKLMLDRCPAKINKYYQATFADTFSYRNNSNNGKFYDKKKELLDKDSHYHFPEQYQGNLIRFEITVTNKSIPTKQFFGTTLRLPDLFKWGFVERMASIMLKWFDDYIFLFFVNSKKDETIRHADIFSLLKNKWTLRVENTLLLVAMTYALENVSLDNIFDDADNILSKGNKSIKPPSKSFYKKLLLELPSTKGALLIHELKRKLKDKLERQKTLLVAPSEEVIYD